MTPKVRKFLNRLKQDFPLRRSVRVRTSAGLVDEFGHRLFGCVRLISDQFRIEISTDHHESVQIDTLWHEWTHCLLWPRCKYRHSKAFWECYGRIYRHYQDEN